LRVMILGTLSWNKGVQGIKKKENPEAYALGEPTPKKDAIPERRKTPLNLE
jgi:hypothetical protein